MSLEENEKDLMKKAGLRVFKGVITFEKANHEVDEVENMDTREDDIWVCTFPRSGTTLTQEMVYLIQTLDFETANTVHLDARFPQAELHDERFPYFKGLKGIAQKESPRMIKSHLHYSLLPKQLKEGKGRIIYICRNPKDVIISYFKWIEWAGFAGERDNTLDKCLDNIVNGKEYACPWPRHLLEYWKHRNDKNILFLRFEDIVEDKPAIIRLIAEFLGKELGEDDVQKIAEHCNVSKMRENPMVNLKYYEDMNFVQTHLARKHINKGQPGTWRDELTTEQSEKVDTMIKQLEGSGLAIANT